MKTTSFDVIRPWCIYIVQEELIAQNSDIWCFKCQVSSVVGALFSLSAYCRTVFLFRWERHAFNWTMFYR